MSLQEFLQQHQQRVEQALERLLPGSDVAPQKLHQAMRYVTLGGGKRIRAILVYASGSIFNSRPEQLDAPACALELIHAYSLVHDDLPAMDDDDLRRGKPTCHIAYDEATALLVGDSLQTLAFDCLANDPFMPDNPSKRLQMIHTLAQASGSLGMAGGQAIDLDGVGKNLSLDQLKTMHSKKTGALIRASVVLGALTGDKCNNEQLQSLDRYAQYIGLAFQIQDDILDVESDTATLGKTQGADQAKNKPTYPAIMGLEQAKTMAQSLIDEALKNLEKFGTGADPLRGIAGYIVDRRH
ncbi:MAG: (2E,6E)-farnesyl diphosphate synthase [Gammaproteobacteria bacterium]|nr:(2E,6E)-farnesyl diphosphate synthase [Gammaproteobacteria bacterium]MDH5802504.1 (2E,6E)-farnesyl diphosphate synthase [Gammaproteobacteria bacterium]